jgi:hypothetical protein
MDSQRSEEMSIETTIKGFLDNIPDKDCVQYDLKTDTLLFLFDVHYRKRGKWWGFKVWAESDLQAAQDLGSGPIK